MTRFVLLGGTFDPVHAGHLSLAAGAAEVLDAVAVLVVEPGHRHRATPIASLDDRRRLVRAAVGEHPALREATELSLEGGLEHVVAQLAEAGHEVHVVFGADSARHLPRWNGAERLRPAQLWVAPREHDAAEDLHGVSVLPIRVPDVSATRVRLVVAAGRHPGELVPASVAADVVRLYSSVDEAHEVSA